MTTIDYFSLTTVPVEQFFHDTLLGTATAFVWKERGNYYLITNRHIVTCKDHFTGRALAQHAGRPNRLRALFNPRALDFGKHAIDILIRDANDQPCWLIHPTNSIDVVAIPLLYGEKEPLFDPHPINTAASAPLRIQIGMDVFVLGYPFGPEPPGFPVWKRGSIASEPELARLGTGYMLIDSASRPGMSGAPVIRRSWTTHLMEDGSTLTNFETATKFLGVYSGRRRSEDKDDPQLALVWPESYIPQIIAGARNDE